MMRRMICGALVLAIPVMAGACQAAEGGPPEAITQAAGQLLVVNKSSNSLSIVDPETRETMAEIATGFAPHEVAVSADGRFAYVTDYGTGQQAGNTITVVDLESREVVRTISLAPHTRPHGIAMVSDGTFWDTTDGSAHVLHVDPESGTILQAVETGQRTTHQVVVAEEAGRVVTANIGSGSASVVDASSGEVIAHLETGAGAEGIDVHPDGSRVYVTNRSAGTMAEIDLATSQVTRTLEVGDFPIRVKVREGGREALVSNSRGNEIAAVDLES